MGIGVKKLGILIDLDDNGIGVSSARLSANRWRYANRKVALLTPRRADTDFNDLV